MGLRKYMKELNNKPSNEVTIIEMVIQLLLLPIYVPDYWFNSDYYNK